MKFKTKSKIVDAIQWNGEFKDGVFIIYWMIAPVDWSAECPKCHHSIKEHGRVDRDILCPGDWIITDETGKRYVVSQNEFEQGYELINQG